MSQNPSGALANYTLSIVRDTAALATFESEWNQLFESSPTAATPLRHAWVKHWWAVFGPIYGRELWIYLVRRDDRLVGVLPLYLQQTLPLLGVRRLRFISTGGAEFEETCTEYLNLLHAEGEAAPCVQIISRHLLDRKLAKWDELDLADMPGDSPLLALRTPLVATNAAVREESQECYCSEAPEGMESYITSLASTTRKKARKHLRDIDNKIVDFEICQTPEQALEFFDELVALHRRRWTAVGKTGSFAPRHAAFHRAVVGELAPDRVKVCRLSTKGKAMALFYGHRNGSKFDSYQMGVDHDCELIRTPGALCFMAFWRSLMEEGVVTFDHLRGLNGFKRDYARHVRALVSLKFTRRHARVMLRDSANILGRGIRKMKAALRKSTTTAVLPPQGITPDKPELVAVEVEAVASE